jgi:hypothetical protein
MKTRNRRTWKSRGGFVPSAMVGLTQAGPFFVTMCLAQGSRLIANNRARMASRRIRKPGKHVLKKSKRTTRRRK